MSHYNIAPVLDIYGNVANSDLRSVSEGIKRLEDLVVKARSLPLSTDARMADDIATVRKRLAEPK